MYPTNFPGVSNQRGTPAIDKFDAAADLCVMYLKSQIRDSGRTANWFSQSIKSTPTFCIRSLINIFTKEICNVDTFTNHLQIL